jgi:hypothetical protein
MPSFTWRPGDPCPHCGSKEKLKFNGGSPVCLRCHEFVDIDSPAVDIVDPRGWTWTPANRDDDLCWYLSEGRETDEFGRTVSGPHVWVKYYGDSHGLGWGPWVIGHGGSPRPDRFETIEAALASPLPAECVEIYITQQEYEIEKRRTIVRRVLDATRVREPNSLVIRTSEIVEGDRFLAKSGSVVWEAIEPADTSASTGEVAVRVQYSDGGISDRIWDDDRDIKINRIGKGTT